MNFEIASEIITAPIETIIVADDIALPKEHSMGRRGVAGTLIIEKMVGAAAEREHNLAYCKSLGDRISDNTASMGAALTSCTVPALGKPTFDIGVDEIEFGVGIHGEPGRKREKIKMANHIVEDMVSAILKDFDEKSLDLKNPNGIILLVNGFSGTPLSELYLIYQAITEKLEEKEIHISRSLVGNYTTALDMAGASITMCLLDEEIKKHWDSSVLTSNLRWGN